MTANLQARRRLGLTATLVREDGREGDVFSLIGPKRYDAPVEGHRVPGLDRTCRLRRGAGDDELLGADGLRDRRAGRALPPRLLHPGQVTGGRACWSSSTPASRRWSSGSTSTSSTSWPRDLDAPVIKGETPVKERQRLFEAFRTGEINLLVVSKVANFSIDLPEAAVAIQVSGSFGSRQEEAQRLGRLLRPKADGRTARFYAVVARDSVDADFAQNRQRFLAEQGYAYRITDADDLLRLTPRVRTSAGGRTRSCARSRALSPARRSCHENTTGPVPVFGGRPAILVAGSRPAFSLVPSRHGERRHDIPPRTRTRSPEPLGGARASFAVDLRLRRGRPDHHGRRREPLPDGIGDTPLAGFPTAGPTYGVLTTGNAAFADDANDSDSTSDQWNTEATGIGADVWDAQTARIDMRRQPRPAWPSTSGSSPRSTPSTSMRASTTPSSPSSTPPT